MSQKTRFKFSAGALGAIDIGSFARLRSALSRSALVVGGLKLGKGSFGSLEIGELTVRRLKVKELQVEENLQLAAEQSRELREPA
jgi:hypothetical protein